MKKPTFSVYLKKGNPKESKRRSFWARWKKQRSQKLKQG